MTFGLPAPPSATAPSPGQNPFTFILHYFLEFILGFWGPQTRCIRHLAAWGVYFPYVVWMSYSILLSRLPLTNTQVLILRVPLETGASQEAALMPSRGRRGPSQTEWTHKAEPSTEKYKNLQICRSIRGPEEISRCK